MSRIIIEYRTLDNIEEIKTMELPEDALGVTIAGFGVKMDKTGLEIESGSDQIRIEPISINMVRITKTEN